MPYPNPTRLAALSLVLSLAGCMSLGKTFDSTTSAGGHLKASDAASHSKARIRRDGREVVVEEAYRFDLAKLVDVDAGYVPGDYQDEGAQTKDETLISMAIHGAFGMGTFNAVLDKVDTPWAKQIMAQTRIGKPFLVRSLSPKRDDYYVVPVFYKSRWGVANHVGVTAQGTYYSNGFTIPNMPIEKPESKTAYGRANVDRRIAHLGKLQEAPERVWVETDPPQQDAVMGYCWLLKTDDGMRLMDTQGHTGGLTAVQAAQVKAGKLLEGAISLQ
ncbi:MAG TPA: hypothetical protein V6D05_16525 [Stenomitos sp.]